MTTKSHTVGGQTSSRMSLQSSQTMSLAKTLHVQDQIIEELRADQAALREALEAERHALRDCRLTSDREMKALQRENMQINKIAKQQEVKIEELEKALSFAKESLANEQRSLKSLEKEHINTMKELKLKNSKEYEKSNKQEMMIDQLKSELEDLKEALESERNATNLLIREHNAEVKTLREEVRAKSTEAYRELKERAMRERDEYREMQEEAERTYKVLEKDFREALAAKDEELKKVKAEARLIQKELEDQLRTCLKEPTPHLSSSSLGHHDYLGTDKIRKLKNEVSILKEQNRKLLSELELLAGEEKLNEIKKENYFLPFSFQLSSENTKVSDAKQEPQTEVLFSGDRASRSEINRLGSESNFRNLSKLNEIRTQNRTIYNLRRDLSLSKQTLEKVQRLHGEELDRIRLRYCDASAKRAKPPLPVKQVKSTCESRTTHVRDMVRRLQELQNAEAHHPRTLPRQTEKTRRRPPAVEDGSNQASNKTIEDLRAIDEDIEKLRKQIEERDKIISALREAAEVKDKKLDQMMAEYSKIRTEKIGSPCGASSSGGVQERNLAAFSTSPPPPLCNGELCWTDGFVNKNYHEPVYAQLLNDHTALQKVYNELREKLDAKTKEAESEDSGCNSRKTEPYENGINLIMAEQIRILKEREAQLMSEAEELREQNDLMEFRILELEECRKEELINEHKHRSDKGIWSERDLEEVSDSGVMSLPTSEDLTSDSELSDTIKNYLHSDNVIVPTLFPQITTGCNDNASNDLIKQKKVLRSAECLQESGIFEDSELGSEGGSLASGACESPVKQNKACQTESILDKTLLDIIDSSCDQILSKSRGYRSDVRKPGKSDDLTAEISKLTEIQKRIQEKNVCEQSPGKGAPAQGSPCPHSNSIVFYEERLRQLEDKLKIYESSGDTKDALLRKRLDKEIELTHRVKQLNDKVSALEAANRQIEEEKCEFEEAENDSRFQCQRLEIKVQELMEKNSGLELELERQKMLMAGDRAKAGKKNNVKQKENIIDDEDSLSVLQAAIPAILAWNMYCLNQTKEEISESLKSEALVLDEKEPPELCKSIEYPNAEVFQKLEELISDQKKLRVEYEKAEEEARQREKELKQKIEELEGKSTRDREILEELTTYLKSLRGEDSSSDSAPSTGDFEMFEELKQLAENEIKMRRKIDNLERKEQAYLQTLQQADEIWAGMEAEYKKKLAAAEDDGLRLRDKVTELESKRVQLEEERVRESEVGKQQGLELMRKVDALTIENEELKGKVTHLANAELESRVNALESENATLKSQIEALREELPLEKKKSQALALELEAQKEKFRQDKLTIEKMGKDLEERSKSLETVETNLNEQISDLTQELAAKSKELSNLEVTVAELREEVETLENRVTELVGALQNSVLDFQDDSSSMQIIVEPRSSPPSESSVCNGDVPLMKVMRVSCEDMARCDQSDPMNGVKKLKVPMSIAEQLIKDNSQVIINAYDGLPRPQDQPKCKRSVLKSFDTRSESEVTLLMDDTECSAQEIVFVTEKELQVTILLYPEPEPDPPILIKIPYLTPSPRILRLAPKPPPQVKVLHGYANRSVVAEPPVATPTFGETQTTDVDWSDAVKEAYVSELSVKNEILQSTLEKMEEESRLKDLELIELQKTVSEIRKEQQELEMKLMEQAHQIPVESRTTEVDLTLAEVQTEEYRSRNDDHGDDEDESDNDDDDDDEVFEDLDNSDYSVSSSISESKAVGQPAAEEFNDKERPLPQIPTRSSTNLLPFLFKSAQQLTPSMTNLQVAWDNLQNKCRVKNAVFRSFLEEIKDIIDGRCYSEILKRIIPEYQPAERVYGADGDAYPVEPHNGVKICDPCLTLLPAAEACPGSRNFSSALSERGGLSKSIRYPTPEYPLQESASVAATRFSFTVPITELRRVGSSSVFIQWDTQGQPSTVTGFEICVNGNFQHRVRSATRNKALLQNVDCTQKNTISLYPVTAKGRSTKCTSVIFPEEVSIG